MRKLIVVILFLPCLLCAQPKTTISSIILKSNVWKDTIAFLALHKGNQLFVVDTLRLNDKGKAKSKGEYIIGQYELVMPNRTQYPLIINEKKLNLKQDSLELSYGNSKENDLFSRFIELQNAIDIKRKKLRSKNLENRIATEAKLKTLETRRVLLLSGYSEIIKNTFAGAIVNAICKPNDLEYYTDHPESALWVKDDFLAPVSLKHSNMLFTQIFHERIKFYLTQIVERDKDALIPELISVLERSKNVAHNYEFLVDYYIGYYQRNKRPESEIAFKTLVNDYVLAGQTPWVDEYKIVRLEAQVQFLRNQSLGDNPTSIKVFDTNGNALDYNEKRAQYQLMLFWDPDCSHCKVEVPEYYSVFNKFKNEGFSVIAIYDQIDKEAWVNFIKENDLNWMNGADIDRKGNLNTEIIITETPTVLLLDKNGTIINKRLTPLELKDFLKEHLN